MIYDTLAHYRTYLGLHPNLDKALRFLAETDLEALPDGRRDIDGSAVFANLMRYETRTVNDTPESHRLYADIQYVISGRELVGVAPLDAMTEVVSDNQEGDIWLHRGPTEQVTLGDGRFLVLFPQDAHAPGIAYQGVPAPARKAVVKVRLD